MVIGKQTRIIAEMRRFLGKLIHVGCLLSLLHAGTTFAQFLDQGAITGIVQDQSGAIVPGAQVTLLSTDTGLELHANTNASGVYFLAGTEPCAQPYIALAQFTVYPFGLSIATHLLTCSIAQGNLSKPR